MFSSFFNATLHQKVMQLGGFFSAALIISIPFLTSVSIIISGILLLLWLLSGQPQKLPTLLKNNPVALYALLLFVFLLIGISYGNTPLKEAFSNWVKYRELLLLLILLTFLKDPFFQKWCSYAFIIGAIGTLFISYGMYVDIFPRPLYAATLKSIITHSIMVAFFAFFCAQKIIISNTKKLQIIWVLLLLLSMHNLYFVAMGRTGQFIGPALILLYCFQHLSKKCSFLVISIFSVLIILFINFSDVGFRITEGITNTLQYDSSNPETETSMGKRLTFWKSTTQLIEEKPLLGHGTGSFKMEFERITGKKNIGASNPHNEFLNITSQIGLPGLILFLGFLFYQYRCQRLLSGENHWLAQGLLVSFIITCLFNTPILDHTEGHWFMSLMALFYAPLSNESYIA